MQALYLIHHQLAFSILYRIEWVETGGAAGDRAGDGGFQYPVSDRMG